MVGGPAARAATFRADAVADRIRRLVREHGSLTAEELARLESVSPVLAAELLLVRSGPPTHLKSKDDTASVG